MGDEGKWAYYRYISEADLVDWWLDLGVKEDRRIKFSGKVSETPIKRLGGVGVLLCVYRI